MTRPLPLALMIAAALTGALFELLRRWWLNIGAAGIGEGE